MHKVTSSLGASLIFTDSEVAKRFFEIRQLKEDEILTIWHDNKKIAERDKYSKVKKIYDIS